MLYFKGKFRFVSLEVSHGKLNKQSETILLQRKVFAVFVDKQRLFIYFVMSS